MITMPIVHRKLNFGGSFIILGCILVALMFIIGPPYYTVEKKRSLSDPHAENKTNCQPLCKIPSLISGRQFYDHFTVREYQCKDLRWFGDKDGRKAVCFDKAFNWVPGDCVVLSFGINNEWSFDDALDKFGCKVFAFDPTMTVGDHKRSENIQFLRLGIGNVKGKRKVGMGIKFDFFEVDRYENILERLNLTNTVIDYIKMDVEISELEFFQDIFRNSPHLLKNIKQIGMEVHHGYFGEGISKRTDKTNDMSPTSTFQLFWQYFHELKCHGFKLMHSRKNTPWTEVVWARI